MCVWSLHPSHVVTAYRLALTNTSRPTLNAHCSGTQARRGPSPGPRRAGSRGRRETGRLYALAAQPCGAKRNALANLLAKSWWPIMNASSRTSASEKCSHIQAKHPSDTSRSSATKCFNAIPIAARRSRVTRGEVVRGSSSVSASPLSGGHIRTGTIRHLPTTCMRRQLWSCSNRRSTLSSSRRSPRLRPDRLRRPSSSDIIASPRARITPTCRRARIPGSKSPRGRSDEVGANCSVNDTARTDVASRRARAVLDTVLFAST